MAYTPDEAVDQFNTQAGISIGGFSALAFRKAVQFIIQHKELIDELTTALAGYQPLDAQLTSLAGLSFTGNANKVIRVKADESTFELATPATGGVDTANSPNANEFARFTDADTIEGRTVAETKSDLSLNNVDNTSDVNKPVSTAQQAALDL